MYKAISYSTINFVKKKEYNPKFVFVIFIKPTGGTNFRT